MIAELRRLLDQATPAEWCRRGRFLVYAPWSGDPEDTYVGNVADAYSEVDAALIVALRNHADALLDVVEACREHVSAEDEWGLRYGMGRERVPYRRALDAANRELRLKLAAWDALGKEEA